MKNKNTMQVILMPRGYGKATKEVRDYITNLQEDLANYVNVVLHDRKVIDDLQQRINKVIEYINVELFNSNIDWVRNNNGCVTGSDLPGDAIFPIIDILQGEDK